MALSALPSWRNPTTALNREITSSATAVVHCLMAKDTIDAPTRISCM